MRVHATPAAERPSVTLPKKSRASSVMNVSMSGAASAFDQGFRCLRNGGTAAILGIPSKPITWNITEHVVFKGATVLGINGRKMFETWYQMEELLLSGRLELDEIITHEFPLEDFQKAFKTMISGDGIKVVMNVNP